MTTKNNVTRRGESDYFDVCANHVEITMTRDELRTLRAEIDAALFAPDPDCKWCHGEGIRKGLYGVGTENDCKCVQR